MTNTAPGEDEILKEVRETKEALGAEYNHDLHALFARIKEREKRSTHPIAKDLERMDEQN